MRLVFGGIVLCLVVAASAGAQNAPILERHDSTMVSFGVGTTMLPTNVLAAKRLGDGGGGIIGGQVTIGGTIVQEISAHWRIPVSVSIAFLRGEEQFYAREINGNNDTIGVARLLANQSNAFTLQAGIEYYERHELISPYFGADFAYNNIGFTSLTLTVPIRNETLLSQALPTSSRFGVVLHAGAEFPLYDQFYYDVIGELGAFNLFGRSTGDKPAVGQLLSPTQVAFDQYAWRLAEGKSGEDAVTYFRILLKIAYRF